MAATTEPTSVADEPGVRLPRGLRQLNWSTWRGVLIRSGQGFVKDKRMKMLAVTTAKRMSLFPDVPTLAESGMTGFEVGAWQGIMVPAATPKAVVDRLSAEVNKALQSADVRAKLAVQGAEPLGSTPADYGAYVKKELARWAAVVKQSGVTIE